MIRGIKIRLRAMEHDALPQSVHWINNPGTRHFMAIDRPLSTAEEETWWQTFLQQRYDQVMGILSKDFLGRRRKTV
jgi:ribosomal protein S10